MKTKKAIQYIKSDFYRTHGVILPVWKILIESIKQQFQGPGSILWLRLAQCDNVVISFIAKLLKHHYSHKYCNDIGTQTVIGKGLHIGHGMGIVINYHTIIGNNVNISQFVTIGSADGKYAAIGDNVYIGPHVCIVGGVKIGNNVTIGACAVVTRDIPDNATVVGVPAKVLNYNELGKYIKNKFERDIL